MQTNDDLIAVRDLRAGTAEPTDVQVARVRRRVLSTLDSPARTSGSRRWMLAAAGAAAATVLAIGVAVVAPPGTGPAHQPGTGLGQQPGAQPNLPERVGQVLAVDLTTTPLAIPDGAYLYVAESHEGYRHEKWVDPYGGIVVGIVINQAGQPPDVAMPPDLGDPYVAAQRADFAAEGPSLVHPTPAFLATLPTDPAALLALICDQLGRPGGGGAVRDDLIFKGSMEFLAVAEPLLSPEVRAAYLQALALAPGAAVDHSPRIFAGHDVYVVKQSSDFGLAGFIVDASTGRVVGYAAGKDQASLDSATEITYAVVTAPGTRP